MKVKDIPKIERPREKLIKYGVCKLTDAELLSIIIRSGRPGKNVIDLARDILKLQLSLVKIKDLTKVNGIGLTKACQIVASLELGKRLTKTDDLLPLISPLNVWNELRDIRSLKKEQFICFYLDVRNQVIKREIISVGTLNASLVHPRDIFEPAILNYAAQIIISHNHPSGDPTPSKEDVDLTSRLVAAGKLLGIEIIDHVVVSSRGYVSFVKQGLI